MKHHDVVQGFGLVQAGYRKTRFVLARISSGSQYHASRGPVVQFNFQILEGAFVHGLDDIHQIGLQQREHNLRLRVAHAAVEFDDPGTAFGNDQTAV